MRRHALNGESIKEEEKDDDGLLRWEDEEES